MHTLPHAWLPSSFTAFSRPCPVPLSHAAQYAAPPLSGCSSFGLAPAAGYVVTAIGCDRGCGQAVTIASSVAPSYSRPKRFARKSRSDTCSCRTNPLCGSLPSRNRSSTAHIAPAVVI